MLLKFLAKQWLNDEPLPARGKRAEGTILTEIRRAPPLVSSATRLEFYVHLIAKRES